MVPSRCHRSSYLGRHAPKATPYTPGCNAPRPYRDACHDVRRVLSVRALPNGHTHMGDSARMSEAPIAIGLREHGSHHISTATF